ncbi:hypothetical protein CAC42_7324 [Sphaceloma murrayae]|uniref:RING-type domain-containing protein n=1 Tax=Sphaceloma murrayae TaxID=2082308 RepID=A0A2K1QWY4_9PEZI|nr:hypothetical protein CAC42_7324 [Sphaceloma murrayae]
MGTLTGRDTRLPHQCEHKLPTSCRLTSLHGCCACADERAHSPTYTTYIDGVGLVPRGRRWDRYCWFCKEFWNNRVAATNLLPSQTRIPEVPDQSGFLQKWYEFHRGYRVVTKEDGSEERIAVLGEPWEDVSPGQLPRTLDELRAGAQRSSEDQPQQIEIQPPPIFEGPSLDETFDALMLEAESEDEEPARSSQPRIRFADFPGERQSDATNEQARQAQNRRDRDASGVAGNVMQASEPQQAQQRRIASLRRELLRMRGGLERVVHALRDLGDSTETAHSVDQLAQLDRSLSQIVDRDRPLPEQEVQELSRDRPLDERIQERTAFVQERRRLRDETSGQIVRLDAHIEQARNMKRLIRGRAEQYSIDVLQGQHQLDRLRQERRSAENYRRVFGTREDMEREDWVSPINQMFTRAYDRFRDAEQARLENRSSPVWGVPGRAPDSARGIPDRTRRVDPDSMPTQDIDDFVQSMEAEDTDMQEMLQDYYRSNLTQEQSRPRNPTQDAREPSSLGGQDLFLFDELEDEFPTLPRYNDLLTMGPDSPEIHTSSQGNDPVRSLLNQEQWFLPPDFPLHPAHDPIIRDVPAPIRPRRHHAHPAALVEPQHGGQGLDVDDDRPEAKTDENMTVKMDCKVCFTQTADTACLPCGHLVMCRWCSEQHSPSLKHDRTTPSDPDATCPACRKVVKKKIRVRLG